MMAERKTGLIINISSIGGLAPLFNCAYGVGKAACDRMAADCAIELKDQNVAMISLWPGAVSTEAFVEKFVENGSYSVDKLNAELGLSEEECPWLHEFRLLITG